MHLTIDIGNTSVKYGLFDRKGRLIEYHILPQGEKALPGELFTTNSVKSASYCVTGKMSGVLKRQIGGLDKVMELTHLTPAPFRSTYKTPATIGKDRLAGLWGAYRLAERENVLIVDAGTCITVDVLTNEGVHLGGNILPGLRMRIRAMHEFTAKLPAVSLSLPPELLGTSTETALQNGAVRGVLMEISALRQKLLRRFGSLKTVLTGGDAEFLDKAFRFQTVVRKDLILQGLYEAYAYNFLRKHK